jgi:hypothetical protein
LNPTIGSMPLTVQRACQIEKGVIFQCAQFFIA